MRLDPEFLLATGARYNAMCQMAGVVPAQASATLGP